MGVNLNSIDSLSDNQKDLIKKHLECVIEANKVTNLTRIDSMDSGMLLHIEDSLAALEEADKAPAGKYIDLGSGGGFPGFPLAIATGRKTTLIDARQRKIELLNEFAEQLNLSDQVVAVHSRIEEFSRTHKNQYSLVTARALSKLSILLELASPLLKQGGRLICYKARMEESEFEHAKKISKQVGFSLVSLDEYFLSDGETFRTLVVFEKIGPSKIKLPRRDGFAQNKPL